MQIIDFFNEFDKYVSNIPRELPGPHMDVLADAPSGSLGEVGDFFPT